MTDQPAVPEPEDLLPDEVGERSEADEMTPHPDAPGDSLGLQQNAGLSLFDRPTQPPSGPETDRT